MSHLHRELAPISDRAWEEIEKEARRSLKNFLAARQLIDFSGPHGWDYSAESLGRLDRVPDPVDGVEAGVRVVQPLVELRHRFTMDRSAIEDIDRGRPDPDLSRVGDAARQAALAEDRIVFEGFKDAGITGIAEASTYPPIQLDNNYAEYPKLVARAVSSLREAGIDGPYAAALGPRCWTGVMATTEDGGYPVLEHLRLILGGPVVWAPAVDGAVVLSVRGEDFQLTCGEDMGLGYLSHNGQSVELFLEESIGFRVLTPEAAVALRHVG